MTKNNVSDSPHSATVALIFWLYVTFDLEKEIFFFTDIVATALTDS